jgi:hypothetical protein
MFLSPFHVDVGSILACRSFKLPSTRRFVLDDASGEFADVTLHEPHAYLGFLELAIMSGLLHDAIGELGIRVPAALASQDCQAYT